MAETGSGAALVIPAQCSSLRKGGYVMLKGHPCKIVEMTTSKTGKHGHAKAHIVGLDVFDNKKYEENCPSTHNIDVPKVSTAQYEVTTIDEDGYLTLMDETGECREDLTIEAAYTTKTLADEVKTKLSDEEYDIFVTVMSTMGEQHIISAKFTKIK